MFYAKIENKTIVEWPIYSDDLRARFPHISFPAGVFEPPSGYVLVEPADTPETDYTKSVVELPPVFNKGVWTQSFQVSQASAEEMAERTAAAWAGVRQQRNKALGNSDWTQLPDAPVDADAWLEYRQQLRDITEQADPFAVVWPTAPKA